MAVSDNTAVNLGVSPYVIPYGAFGFRVEVNSPTEVRVRSGVVNNNAEIQESFVTIGAGSTYLYVQAEFTINTDGTVELDREATANNGVQAASSLVNEHVQADFAAHTCRVYCYIAEVTKDGDTVEIDQWINGNFFVSPLGYEKQIWLC